MTTSETDENYLYENKASANLKTFINAMGGHIRTSHLVKIFKGFHDSEHPIKCPQYREGYNRDNGLSATLFRNTKFRDNPLREFYPLSVMKNQRDGGHKEYNPKLIDYMINPSKNNYQTGGVQCQKSSLSLSMGRHTHLLGRSDNRVLRQANFRPAPVNIIRTVDNRYYRPVGRSRSRRSKASKQKTSLVVTSDGLVAKKVNMTIHSLKDFFNIIRSEMARIGPQMGSKLIQEQLTQEQLTQERLKRCIGKIASKSHSHSHSGINWVPVRGSLSEKRREGREQKPLQVEVTDQLANITDDSLQIVQAPEAETKVEMQVPTQDERDLAEIKCQHPSVGSEHLKLVEQLLIEVRQLMHINCQTQTQNQDNRIPNTDGKETLSQKRSLLQGFEKLEMTDSLFESTK